MYRCGLREAAKSVFVSGRATSPPYPPPPRRAIVTSWHFLYIIWNFTFKLSFGLTTTPSSTRRFKHQFITYGRWSNWDLEIKLKYKNVWVYCIVVWVIFRKIARYVACQINEDWIKKYMINTSWYILIKHLKLQTVRLSWKIWNRQKNGRFVYLTVYLLVDRCKGCLRWSAGPTGINGRGGRHPL